MFENLILEDTVVVNIQDMNHLMRLTQYLCAFEYAFVVSPKHNQVAMSREAFNTLSAVH